MHYNLTLTTDWNLILMSLEQQLRKSKLSSTLKYQLMEIAFYTPRLPSGLHLIRSSLQNFGFCSSPLGATCHDLSSKPQLARQKPPIYRAENTITICLSSALNIHLEHLGKKETT